MYRRIPELSQIYHLLLFHSIQKASLLVEHGNKQPAAQSGFFCDDLDKSGRKNDFQLRFILSLLHMGLFVGLVSDFCPWGS